MADSVVTQVPGGGHSFSPASEIGTKDKSVGWYEQAFSGCPSDARELLENYAGVPADDVDAHIVTIRDKAWDIYPYPCIGQFSFLNLTLRHQPSYASMVARLKSGEARYLDIGFCLGQDIRKLVADGVPSQNIYGAELHGPFIDLGYDLWRDRDTLQAHLMQADALTLEGGSLGDLQGTIDYIHLGMVLHVFDRPRQALLLENCVRLLKPDQPGTMILGGAVGDVEGFQTSAGFFLNSDVTLRQLCAEVSERMGRRLDCRVNALDTDRGKWGTDRSRRLAFKIEML
ncbi:hypothetical protein F4809DRAFT_627466 [Biscogniauxia mediterranea]|nr:hypothetical protein F4809DRAFT_627466 [Biscogniauxia mediterranea]